MQRTTKEWQAIKRQREFTQSEREELFGDVEAHNTTREPYNTMLIERYQQGLPLTKADAKEARRLLKQGR